MRSPHAFFKLKFCEKRNAEQGHRHLMHMAGHLGGIAKLGTLVLAIMAPFGCVRQDPQKAYDHAWSTYQHGDLIHAQEEADKGYANFHMTSPEWAWKFTILRARTLCERGRYEQAIKLLASEPAAPTFGELAIRKAWLEGLAHTSLHNCSEAERSFADAQRLCGISNYPVCSDLPSAQGKLEMARGRYAQAQVYFDRALVLARTSGDLLWESDALLDLSWNAEEQTHYDQALDWADAARKIALEKSVPDIAQTALGNMGWAYYELGDLERAKDMFLEAHAQATKVGNATDEIRWLVNAGYIYMDTRDLTVAEQSFRRSLDLARKISSRESIVDSVTALAGICEQTDKLDEARHYADEALSMARADGNKSEGVEPRLVQGRVAAKQHDITTAETAFHEVAQSPDSPVFLKWQAEHSLARLYEDENQAPSADREYKTALSTFEEARASLRQMSSRLPFLTNATAIYDDYIHFLVTQGKPLQALQVAEYSRARTLSEGLGLLHKGTAFAPDPLNPQEIARRAGGAIFFYWLGDKQSYLWVITPQKTTLLPLPPASQIDAAVQRYRKSLLGPQDVLATADEDGRSLYATLVAPAQKLLPKNTTVFIIPDGDLNALNFETLLVSEPKLHYWIEDATIANASSLRLLAAGNAHHAASKTLLLLGDALPPNSDYPGLPKAAAEIDIVRKHFPSAQEQIFSRDQATPLTYLSRKPEQFSYIHFVAHGTASRLSPLDSAIVLSKATAQDDSFKLYARDIIQHPLRADLVTISTCYGAGARAYSGEGMVGLSWAFLRAGAHNVIGALWEVSDASTPQLMDELYIQLNQGKSPVAALRAAKLSLLNSGSAFRQPFYWAPFQLYTGR